MNQFSLLDDNSALSVEALDLSKTCAISRQKSNADDNGKFGVIVGFDETKQRYQAGNSATFVVQVL